MRVVATAGHVDHGKSTLLRALTGMEPDRWAEEQRRGLTIDLGFVWADLDDDQHEPGGESVPVAFVDVPGHEKFTGNMLAGAGAVRLALFVVAADDGWSAQSQEHLQILDLLGVRGIAAVVTKTSLVDAPRVEEVVADVGRRLRDTSLRGSPVLPVDAVSGAGVDELRRVLLRRLREDVQPADEGRPRLWIDRAFSVSGAGTVVTGTLSGGVLTVGDEVVLLPSGRRGRVRGLQERGRDVSVTDLEGRIAVNLSGIDHHEVDRGEALVSHPATWLLTDQVDAYVRAVRGFDVRHKGSWHAHVGSADVPCTVHPLLGEPIAPGAPGWVRVRLARELPLVTGDRLVLRDGGRRATCGGGEIVDPIPAGRVRGADARLARVTQLDAIVAEPAYRRQTPLLDAHGGALPLHTARAALADRVVQATDVEALGTTLVTTAALERWGGAVERSLSLHHAEHPQGPGPDRSALQSALREAGCSQGATLDVLEGLVAAGRVRVASGAYALPSFAPARDEARGDRVAALLAALDADPLSPPALDDVARGLGLDHREINTLISAGTLVRCGKVVFTRSAVDAAIVHLRDLGAAGPFTASQARERWGTSRKYAIPLLEYLDGTGITTFDGSTRTLTGR